MVDHVGKQDRGQVAPAQFIKGVFQAKCIVPIGTECMVMSGGPSELREEREFYFACNRMKARILAYSAGSCDIEMLEGEWIERIVREVSPEILRLSGNFILDPADTSHITAPFVHVE
jgi:hypothetical protein